MVKQLLPALRAMIFLTVLTGLLYPAVVTGLCQAFWRDKANGSLIRKDGHIVGSALLGQNFKQPEYFHPRPSAAGNDGYDATASGGSNLGPTNQKLYDRVKAAAEQFRKENPTYKGPIPADALTASASGLDPHIGIANADAQVARVAEARHANPKEVQKIIDAHTEGRDLGFLGETRVNVLKLNLDLDRQFSRR
jgi:potassium-transporting ATPase KdpC subunit